MTTAAMESLNVKIDGDEKRLFTERTKALGTSPSNAIRMFVRAFNSQGGFPFDTSRPYAIKTAEDALDELESQLTGGKAKRYSSFGDLLSEIDDEIASEDLAHA